MRIAEWGTWRLARKTSRCINTLRSRRRVSTGRSSIIASSPATRCPQLRLSAAQERSVSGIRHAYDEPTIYALSTAPGRAAIAIIRISGKQCLNIYRDLCPGRSDPKPRYASLRTIHEPKVPASAETVLDSNALVLYFPSPQTVTGEDVLELHVHGGPAVVKAVLSATSKCSSGNTPQRDIRYAEPGEFTRRAFMNDRLDLMQVEALGDTLSATTEQQRRLSIRSTTGQLAKQYEGWRKQLLYARGELEALIDFSEDQHFDESPTELCASVSSQVALLKHLVHVHIRNAMRGEMLRNGIIISLLGAPNAGKSSLLNCIVGRDAAIVSDEAGTTRDVVEVGLDIGGYFCRLGDTAGLRIAKQITAEHVDSAASVNNASSIRNTMDAIGQVEKEGMRRAKERAAESDFVIVVLSFERIYDMHELYLDPEVLSTAAELVQSKDNVLVAINKSDLACDPAMHEHAVYETMRLLPGLSKDRIELVSCKDAERYSPGLLHDQTGSESGGVQKFLHSLVRQFELLTAASTPDHADGNGDLSIWQDSLGASERHRILLEQCLQSLDAFIAEVSPTPHAEHSDELDKEADIVVAAEHLRAAADCLAKITGKGDAGDVEEVLGVVFEKFCVGK